MRSVHTDDAPAPRGHYSQAIVHRGLVYVAGQLPWNPQAPDAPLGTAEEQAEQALRNLAAILEAAGSGMDRLLQTTIYVTKAEDWGAVNRVYSRMLGDHRPARAVVPVKELHGGALLEIQATATVDQDQG